MTPRAATDEHSPLDQIRRAEAAVTRRATAARRAAEDTVLAAQAQAADLKRRARELGRMEGLADFQAIVSDAEDEAERLIAQAHSQAQRLSSRGEMLREAAARYIAAVVTGQEMEMGSR